MIQQAIAKVVQGRHLSEEEMAAALEQIMEGRATSAQVGALLAALRLKGETVEEITGAARTMRAKATLVPTRLHREGAILMDVVGTGGDGAGTFNVSTATALVVAGAGVPVAKHGNRAASGTCGSADVLEALGVPLDLTPEEMGACLDRLGIAFLFAPALHPAMRHVALPRRELGLRTIFNLLGPLTNPAQPQAMLLGVAHPHLTQVMAQVLQRLGQPRAMVVCGQGGLDEVSLAGPTQVCHLHHGRIRNYTLTPEDAGLKRAPLEAVRGGSVEDCRRHLLEVLQGRPGPRRDMVLLNAACALTLAGVARDLRQGVALAAHSIDHGQALARLEALAALPRRQPRSAEA